MSVTPWRPTRTLAGPRNPMDDPKSSGIRNLTPSQTERAPKPMSGPRYAGGPLDKIGKKTK